MSSVSRWSPQVVTTPAGTYSLRTGPTGSILDSVVDGPGSGPTGVGDGRSHGRPRAVMIHGLGGSSLNWIELLAALDDDLDSVAVDLPGFGASPPPRDGDYSPRGHANHVADLLDYLDDRRATDRRATADDNRGWHVFGNSLGGSVAVHLAALRPDLVRSLTLISPAMPARRLRRGTAHMPVIAIPGVGERLVARYLELPVERRVEDTVRSVFGDPQRMADERRRMAEDEARGRDGMPHVTDATLSSLRGLIGTFFAAGADRPWRLAERVEVPVLAIYGQRDQLVDAKAAHRITRHFADAHVVVLPDSGHVAMMEHPDDVAASWRRFIGVPLSAPA